VLAIGGVSNDFGTPGVRENAMFLERRADADPSATACSTPVSG
jgi:NADH:ubiquinone reductase (H+-translocating)